MENSIVEKISNISHDLRNSLAIVYSHAQLLQLMLEKNKSANTEEYDTATQLVSSIEQTQALLGEKIDELKSFHSNIREGAE